MTRLGEHEWTLPPDQIARDREVGASISDVESWLGCPVSVNDIELGIRVTDMLEGMESQYDIAFHYHWRITQAMEAQFRAAEIEGECSICGVTTALPHRTTVDPPFFAGGRHCGRCERWLCDGES